MAFSLKQLASGMFSRILLNSNFEKIEDKVNDDLLHRQNGSAQMNQDLDMNGGVILNASDVLIEGGESLSTYSETAVNAAAVATTKASEASSSETAAATSATNSANSATASANSATASANSADSSASSATTSTQQAGIATTQATNASNSATSAAASATTATTQAGIATTKSAEASSSASSAATSDSNAASSASSASTSATTAITQAGIATTKASEAAASAASVDANDIVHAPNSGLANEAGTSYAYDVTESTTDDTVGRLLKVGDTVERVVQTLEDLLSVNPLSAGSVRVLNYHSDVEGGGGAFYWDADKAKSEHNGGTIIDPLAVFPSDWSNQTQLTTWFDTSNTGNGCWVRQYDGAVNVKWFGARTESDVDNTAVIQKALNLGGSVCIPGGAFKINGTLVLNSGNTLFGDSSHGYDGWDANAITNSSRLYKDNTTGLSGALVTVSANSSIRDLILTHSKTNGASQGIIRFPGDQITRYVTVSNVHIEGHRTSDLTGVNTCYGIKLEHMAIAGMVSYFNRFNNIQVHNTDVCFWLGDNANANIFTNIQTKESHIHYELDGGVGETIENSFNGLGLFSISGAINPKPIGFKTTKASGNVFSGYVTEMYGKLFADTMSGGNKFFGHSNEVIQSIAGDSNSVVSTVNGGLIPIMSQHIAQSATAPANTNRGLIESVGNFGYLFGKNKRICLFTFDRLVKGVPYQGVMDLVFMVNPPYNEAPFGAVLRVFIRNNSSLNTQSVQLLSFDKNSNWDTWVSSVDFVVDNTGSLPISVGITLSGSPNWGSGLANTASCSYKLDYQFVNTATAMATANRQGRDFTADEIANLTSL